MEDGKGAGQGQQQAHQHVQGQVHGYAGPELQDVTQSDHVPTAGDYAAVDCYLKINVWYTYWKQSIKTSTEFYLVGSFSWVSKRFNH